MNRNKNSKELAEYLRVSTRYLMHHRRRKEYVDIPCEKRLVDGRIKVMFNIEEVMQWISTKFN